ncbi:MULTISPECIES: hypothetical protein [unclassified Bradyrhizobium]|uniref:hypothetical protein n=1 Tax=unclassified Bradyrhizobium TaxID=2631580 RepID=UPI0028F0CE2A|nr:MULTISPECIES: hypothetical protein [unclassified Bradyrhizobium]
MLDDPLNPPLTAENGARLEVTIRHTSSGIEARYLLLLDQPNRTLTQTEIRTFPDEQTAYVWIEGIAAARGFARYPILHEDEDGKPQ